MDPGLLNRNVCSLGGGGTSNNVLGFRDFDLYHKTPHFFGETPCNQLNPLLDQKLSDPIHTRNVISLEYSVDCLGMGQKPVFESVVASLNSPRRRQRLTVFGNGLSWYWKTFPDRCHPTTCYTDVRIRYNFDHRPERLQLSI